MLALKSVTFITLLLTILAWQLDNLHQRHCRSRAIGQVVQLALLQTVDHVPSQVRARMQMSLACHFVIAPQSHSYRILNLPLLNTIRVKFDGKI